MSAEERPTKAEAEEALSRMVQANPLDLTDGEALKALRQNVADGLLEESVGTDGQPVFKTTAAGEAWAIELIKDQLAGPPPRQDALLHVMEKADEDQVDADREELMKIAGWVLFIEHRRLADRLEAFEDAEHGETLKAVATMLRAGAL